MPGGLARMCVSRGEWAEILYETAGFGVFHLTLMPRLDLYLQKWPPPLGSYGPQLPHGCTPVVRPYWQICQMNRVELPATKLKIWQQDHAAC